ncbi:unnamed protein product [Ambrosiozyma monospora]|uniref:Unnamed protein product n=1 Tax=Ambrosiozyma monospora TaxID=43982 RepID=A0ACB5SYC1_AMBMO|nr:unnamed protein product [Ambrosiozyma monospora]
MDDDVSTPHTRAPQISMSPATHTASATCGLVFDPTSLLHTLTRPGTDNRQFRGLDWTYLNKKLTVLDFQVRPSHVRRVIGFENRYADKFHRSNIKLPELRTPFEFNDLSILLNICLALMLLYHIAHMCHSTTS